ncbi:unnamed protein product [Closterium sp. NIES-64]|nr:unnamed protein product [Closterium sp. NIES-64]
MLTATNHWAPQMHLGDDGYRDLFKGVDPRDGATPWLLKRCRFREFEEFQAEVAEMGNKNHPNLLRLLGYCDEQDRQGRWVQVVVYEFMTAGSLLDKFGPDGEAGLTSHDASACVPMSSPTVHTTFSKTTPRQAKIAGFEYVSRRAAASGEDVVVGELEYVDPHLLTEQPTPTNDLHRHCGLYVVWFLLKPNCTHMEAGLLLPFACLFHAPPLPYSSTAMLLHCHAPLPCSSTAMLRSQLSVLPHTRSFSILPFAPVSCLLPLPAHLLPAATSLGVVLLELLSGHRAFTQEENVEPIRDSVSASQWSIGGWASVVFRGVPALLYRPPSLAVF